MISTAKPIQWGLRSVVSKVFLGELIGSLFPVVASQADVWGYHR